MKHLNPRLLADDMSNIIGNINPPPGSNFVGDDPVAGVAKVLSFVIQLVLLVGGLATLIFLLLAAFEWITSSGDKEKLSKAQQKITSAVVGLLLIVLAFTVFSFFMGTVLGGKFGIDGNWTITLPKLSP